VSTDSEAFLAAVLSAVPMFVVRAGPDLKITYVNRVVHGLTRDEVIGAPLEAFVEPAHRAVQLAAIGRVLETGVPESYEVEGSGPDGSVRWYETTVTALPEPDGRRGICLAAADVSQSRLRERALYDSEERLRLALEATGLGLWSLDLVTGAVEADARLRAILGQSHAVSLETYLDDIVHPDDRARLRNELGNVMVNPTWPTVTHRIVRPDGEIRWIAASGCTVFAGGRPTRLLGGTLDITAQHNAEEQLRHAQRLDAVGRLTAGVAHNFNNLLTVITSTLDLLHRRTGEGGDRRLIDDAREAARRGSDLVRQLMTFASQRPHVERRPCDLAQIVERAVAICQRTFDRHVALDLRVAPDLPAVPCTEAEIEQIVVNLLLNARDAVLAAARPVPHIEVSLDLATRPGTQGPRAPLGVRLRVTDDGVGMTPDVLAHAFEPFFTTKPIGQGTGLGLATSYAIARALDGSLTATSQAGRGTTLALWLPATDRPVEAAAPPPPPATPRSARVLLVDDEPQLRRAVAELLAEVGFAVDVASSGDEALARLARDASFDVVLLDRSMPGARGEHFLPRLRELAPAARIALFTGQEVEPALAARVDGVIGKPIDADDLFQALGELMARPPRGR
jgi:PAS domain S-box-containing protein